MGYIDAITNDGVGILLMCRGRPDIKSGGQEIVSHLLALKSYLRLFVTDTCGNIHLHPLDVRISWMRKDDITVAFSWVRRRGDVIRSFERSFARRQRFLILRMREIMLS